MTWNSKCFFDIERHITKLIKDHALLAHEDTNLSKLLVDMSIAISRMMPLEDVLHESLQSFTLYLRIGIALVDVFVIAGFRDPHQLTCLPDGTEIAPMRLEEFKPNTWS